MSSSSFEAAGKRVGSIAVNLIRLALAFMMVATLTGITRGLLLPTDATAHAWFWLVLSGLVGFTLGDMFLFEALVLVGARVSMLIMSLVPPMTALIGWGILGEHLSPLEILGMSLTVAGVAWVVLERRRDAAGQLVHVPVLGILLALGGAAGQATGLVLSKFGMGDYDTFAAVHIRIIAGITGLAALYAVAGWWPRTVRALRDRPAMARATLGALFGPVLGVSLSLAAVKYTQAGVAATLMALVPVFIIVPAVLIRKEAITLRAVSGAVVAVAGSALLFL
jgi:drug/metabolite transporter (DMT)-like permease